MNSVSRLQVETKLKTFHFFGFLHGALLINRILLGKRQFVVKGPKFMIME
jgi:hypothetical protein